MIYGKAGGAANSKGTMLRKRTARDKNEPDIVKTLKECGALVQPITAKGCPDLMVGWRGKLTLLEVKMPGKRADLTPDQDKFHALWSGYPIHVVVSADEAMRAIGIEVN